MERFWKLFLFQFSPTLSFISNIQYSIVWGFPKPGNFFTISRHTRGLGISPHDLNSATDHLHIRHSRTDQPGPQQFQLGAASDLGCDPHDLRGRASWNRGTGTRDHHTLPPWPPAPMIISKIARPMERDCSRRRRNTGIQDGHEEMD